MLTIYLAITKNGVQILSAPPKPDLSQYVTDNKIRDEEILKILEQPLSRNTGTKKKNKSKKKKPAKKETNGEKSDEESSDEE